MPLSREQQDALFGRGTISARRLTPSQATSPVAAPRDEPRGGFSGFVGAIGERVPQGVKDAASAAGRGFQFLDEPISNRLGIDASGPLDFILEEISRPTNIALALGTALTGGLGAGGFAARSAARAGGRVAARDIGGALGARTAIGGVNRVLPEDASAGLRIPLSIAGALTGAGVGASLAGTLRSVKTAEREAARAAVAMRFGEHGDLVNKFSTRIDEVKPSLVTREASTAQTRAITGEELKHAFSSGPMNEDAAKAVAGIRTGAIDDIGFESVAADFTSADMTHLFTMVKDSTRLNDFAKKRVITMMVDMFSPRGSHCRIVHLYVTPKRCSARASRRPWSSVVPWGRSCGTWLLTLSTCRELSSLRGMSPPRSGRAPCWLVARNSGNRGSRCSAP